jgi:lysozyme
MRTSPAGQSFIKSQESPAGPLLTVQGDTGGKQEIGWGHDLLPGESYPDGITVEQAEVLFAFDVAKVDAAMNAQHLGLDFNENQWTAIADFTFECGEGALIQLLAHGIDQICAQLPRWVRARVNGVEVELTGMVARRAAEVALFNSPRTCSSSTAQYAR